MVCGLQFVCIHYLLFIGSVSLLFSTKGGSEFEHDVVFAGHILRIVSFYEQQLGKKKSGMCFL